MNPIPTFRPLRRAASMVMVVAVLAVPTAIWAQAKGDVVVVQEATKLLDKQKDGKKITRNAPKGMRAKVIAVKGTLVYIKAENDPDLRGWTKAAKVRVTSPSQGPELEAPPPPVRLAQDPAARKTTAPTAAAKPADTPAAPVSLPLVGGARPVRVAVYELTATEGFEPRQLEIISDTLLNEVRKLARVSAVGWSEIRDMLSVEEQKQLMGCGDDSCMAEITGALGADILVTGSIGKIGDQAAFNVRRMNLRTAKVEGHFSKNYANGDAEAIVQGIGPAIEQLFPDYELREGRTRGVTAEVAARLNPPPLKPWVFYSTAGVSAAALAGGGLMALQARSAKQRFDSLGKQAVSDPVPGEDLRKEEDAFKRSKMIANVLFGVGGAVALAAGVEYLFTDWMGDPSIKGTAAPMALQGGAGVQFALNY